MNTARESTWYDHSDESGDDIRMQSLGRCWLDDVVRRTKLNFSAEKRSGIDKCMTQAKLRAFQKGQKMAENWFTKSMADFFYDSKVRSLAIEEGVDMSSDPADMKSFTLSVPKEPRTYEMTKSGDEVRVSTNLKDLYIHLLYLSLLLFVVCSNYTPASYYLTSAIKRLFVETTFKSYKGIPISFTEIDTVDDIFKYLTTHFTAALIRKWYHMGSTTVATNNEDRRNILFENRLFGDCRLKMMRITGDSCKMNVHFKDIQPYCFYYYSRSYQSDKAVQGKEKEKWLHTRSNGSSIRGRFGVYNPDGFIEDISATNIERLEDLQTNHWVQRGTRAVTIQFTLYNPNLNLFCNIILAFEMPPTGSVFPMYKINTVKLTPYQKSWDYLVLGVESGLCLFICYFFLQQIREIMFLGTLYWIHPWHYVDIIITTGMIAIIVTRVIIEFTMQKIFKDFHPENPKRKSFTSFDSVAGIRILHDDIYGIVLFFSWLKIIRYFDFTRVVQKLNSLFFMCASDMAHFIFLVFYFFLTFAQTGSILFGMGLSDYSSLGTTYLTLLRSLAGDTQFDELQQFDPVLGPIYLILFLVFILNIVLNISVSILNEAYLQVKRQGLGSDVKLSTIEYLKRPNYKMLHSGKKSVLFKKTGSSKLYDSDIIQLLLRHGFNPAEIHAFMAKYKLKQYNITHHLTRRRLTKLVQDIKYIEMNSFVPIDFFLNSAQQLRILVEEGDKKVAKKMQEQSTKPEDYARIAKRLEVLDERYDVMYAKIRRLHRILKPKLVVKSEDK